MKSNFRNIFIPLILVGTLFFSPLPVRTQTADQSDRYGEITATLAELKTLTDAMAWVYIDIGYYVSIENLNDLLSDDTIHDFDNIDQFGGTWVIDQDTAFFRPERLDLTRPAHLWQGPYVTYQPSRVSIDGEGYDRGSLLDYWGAPYYLFSPAGLVRGDLHGITRELYGDLFDTYAIVSLGPDGEQSADDLYRTFGMPPTELVITSLTPQEAHPGDAVELKGYNFGAGSRQASGLYIGDLPVTSIESWSARLITFTIPPGAQSGPVKIISGSEESNPLALVITPSPTAAALWHLYE